MSSRLVGAPPCCCFARPQPAAARLRAPPARASGSSSSSSQSPVRLRAVLERVDEALQKGEDEAALSLVRASQGEDGGLRAFGAARQVPQRLYKLDELKLNGIDTSAFLSPVDLTLGSIERNLQIAAIFGGLSISAALELSQLQILFLVLGLLSLWSVDFVYFSGAVSNLVLDTIGHYVSQKYHNRVIQHEAGHFLIAYLLGVLPKGYTITSWDTLINQGSLNVQAGTAFVDYEFLEEHDIDANIFSLDTGADRAVWRGGLPSPPTAARTMEPVLSLPYIFLTIDEGKKTSNEINTGKLSAMMLNKFSCIALAGVATEYLLYGVAEGGLADINQLDGLFKSLGFTQKKADSQVRWAVLNTVLMLRRHEKARSQLAEAMSSGKSVGSCIEVIEGNIDTEDI
ncbi:hypothetical protein ACP4OV_021119 [Aristida adscensionis]